MSTAHAAHAPLHTPSREAGHDAPRGSRDGGPDTRYTWFIVGEAILVVLAMALAVIVTHHPTPLPGDVGMTLAEQHLILPHAALTQALDAVSTINWPVPSAVALVVVTIVLLVLRRRLAAAMALLVAGLADGSSYLTNEIVRRPRPSDHGLHVLQHIKNYFSFPSGHVIHALAFFGLLIFVSYQVRRPAAWVWLIRSRSRLCADACEASRTQLGPGALVAQRGPGALGHQRVREHGRAIANSPSRRRQFGYQPPRPRRRDRSGVIRGCGRSSSESASEPI